MKQWFKNRFKHRNQRGNILISAFVTMVIIGMSVAGIAQLTINQFTHTRVKLENLNGDLYGEALLELAVYEFETYLESNSYDIASYFSTMTTSGLTGYGVFVENMSGLTDVNGDYSGYDNVETFAFRFTYTSASGSTMRLYSYLSSTGSYAEMLDPFDFSMATNGYLIINGGYLRNPSIFGDTILFGNASPFINQATGDPDLTPGASGDYPDFNGSGGNTANVYYGDGFYYCEPYCYELGLTSADPFVVQDSEFLDIIGSGLETGAVNEDKVISDFFGGYDLGDDILDYIKNEGPTTDDTITDSMTMANIASVVMANSGLPGEDCVMVKIKGKWTEVCTPSASTEPYTDVTSETWFDPSTLEVELDFAGVYDGNLTINENFYITNFDTANTETLIITGDLTFANTADIEVDGMIVVLGDLYFTGENVALSGGFYVVGQTYIQFNPDAGFENAGPTTSGYSFSLLTMDNVLIESLFENHDNNNNSTIFNWLIYTEESIYADCVNNVLEVNGVFFAAARGHSGNEIPMEDELGNPIRGIVVNAFNGYINNSGTAVIKNNYSTFDFDPVNEASLTSEFSQLPQFETILISEGVYTFERSEIFYN